MSHTSRPAGRRVLAGALTAVLFLAACGGDDDTAADPKQQLVDDMVDQLSAIGGLEIDEDCVAAKVDELTDEQVAAMSDAVENSTEAPADLADWNASLGSDCLAGG